MLMEKSVKELRSLAVAVQVKGYQNLKKDELVKALESRIESLKSRIFEAEAEEMETVELLGINQEMEYLPSPQKYIKKIAKEDIEKVIESGDKLVRYINFKFKVNQEIVIVDDKIEMVVVKVDGMEVKIRRAGTINNGNKTYRYSVIKN